MIACSRSFNVFCAFFFVPFVLSGRLCQVPFALPPSCGSSQSRFHFLFCLFHTKIASFNITMF